MRIFLSYASERHDVAEGIALALRNEGHAVFLDRDDLPPGSSYDDQIRNAINASDLLVFLISPESVSDGRYTLTELAFARKRWPSPQHRILPVEIAATPFDTVPNYLKAVTILQPQGNRGAEVAAAVADLGRRRTRWRWPATAGGAAALIAVAVLVWQYVIDQSVIVEALKVERLRAGLLGAAPTFQVFARLHNGGRAPLELTTIELQTEPSEGLLIDDGVLPEICSACRPGAAPISPSPPGRKVARRPMFGNGGYAPALPTVAAPVATGRIGDRRVRSSLRWHLCCPRSYAAERRPSYPLVTDSRWPRPPLPHSFS